MDGIFPISKQGESYLQNNLNLSFNLVRTYYLGTNRTKKQKDILIKNFSNSILTCSNIKQAIARSSKKLNRAREAVLAAISVVQN